MWRSRSRKPARIDVGFAAGQEYSPAFVDHLRNFSRWLIKRDAHWLASGLLDCALILRDGPLRVFGVERVRHGNGDARPSVSWHQIILSIAANVFERR